MHDSERPLRDELGELRHHQSPSPVHCDSDSKVHSEGTSYTRTSNHSHCVGLLTGMNRMISGPQAAGRGGGPAQGVSPLAGGLSDGVHRVSARRRAGSESVTAFIGPGNHDSDPGQRDRAMTRQGRRCRGGAAAARRRSACLRRGGSQAGFSV